MGALSVCAAAMPALAIEVPAELEKQYQAAMESRANGDLYDSIEHLNSLLSNNPNLHRARLELAVTYYRAAQYEAARKQADMVLSDPNTPDGVKETIQLFIEQLDAMKTAEDERRHNWQAFVGVGGGYDDNVNAGPASETFDVNGLVFILDGEDGEQSDAFATISARVNHSYRMPGTVNIGSRPVLMLWQSGASIYRKEYQDEHPYTVDVVSLSTGPAWASSTNWRADLDLKLDYVRLGDDALALYSSLNPSYTYVDGKNEYSLRGQWLYREYMAEDDADREGQRYLLGADYTRNINADIAIKAGASAYEQDGRVDYEEFDVQEFYLSGFWTAWEGGALYARVSYRETDYQGQEPAFNIGREEDETRYVAGFSHNFRSGKMAGWGISGRASYSDNESNISIYEYDRSVVSFELTKRF
ncbi:MAG: hypothetical protein AseanaTS_25660 [Candidatus Pelagadaptatus aseana]|uniref:DUF2860 family protein n=1 Tax=Candidatus Pelagadaptatus aseana TaxID=3120508 RepID=UPI0039B22BF1